MVAPSLSILSELKVFHFLGFFPFDIRALKKSGSLLVLEGVPFLRIALYLLMTYGYYPVTELIMRVYDTRWDRLPIWPHSDLTFLAVIWPSIALPSRITAYPWLTTSPWASWFPETFWRRRSGLSHYTQRQTIWRSCPISWNRCRVQSWMSKRWRNEKEFGCWSSSGLRKLRGILIVVTCKL